MLDINKIFEDFLKDTVNLNATRFEKIEKAQDVLGTFVKESDTFEDMYVGAYLQGSARQKTIIKPVGDDDEFDADILIMLKEKTEWSPADYHANLASIFKDSDVYKDITGTRGKTRCVTIDYNSDFHVDLVPAIERDGQMYIFNKSTDEEECTDGDGYSQWFEQQDAYAGGYLVPMVRLIKYLRDSRKDFDTRSVILTTIIGMQVRSDDQFGSLSEAFVTILDRVDDFLLIHDEAPTIQNPAMREETFDRKWKDDDGKSFTAFKKAVSSYADIASGADSVEDWKELFGDKFKEKEEDKGNTAGEASAATGALVGMTTRSFTPQRQYGGQK